MLVYKRLHQSGWKEQHFANPLPATSWAFHLFHSQKNSLFLLLTAPGHRLAPRRSVWGFRGEKNVRQVPSSSCCLQINTRLLASDLPTFLSFYLKRDASWLRTGNRGQTQSSSDCVWMYFVLFVCLFFSCIPCLFHTIFKMLLQCQQLLSHWVFSTTLSSLNLKWALG